MEEPTWKEVLDRVSLLQLELQRLQNELGVSLIAKVTDLKQRAKDALMQLESLPGKLESRIEEVKVEMEDAVGTFNGSLVEVEELFVERIPAIMDATHDHIAQSLASTRDFLENSIMQVSQDNIEKGLLQNKEKIEDGGELLVERFDEFIGNTKANVSRMLEQLSSFGMQWRDAVGGLKGDYDSIQKGVGEIQRDLVRLAETMDLALASTGAGMTSAAGALNEIKRLLEEVV